MNNLSWIPKKYQERVYSIEKENDLIDGCKYMLYFMNGWCYAEYGCIPVRNKKEALYFIKNAYKD